MNFRRIMTDGLIGFAVFFTIIIAINISLYLFDFSKTINIEVTDLYHSLLGSILYVLNGFANKFSRQELE